MVVCFGQGAGFRGANRVLPSFFPSFGATLNVFTEFLFVVFFFEFIEYPPIWTLFYRVSVRSLPFFYRVTSCFAFSSS